MDKKTVKALNEINRQFYLQVHEYFNRTRQFYWDGWKRLLPLLQKNFIKVLDVGCGNGRFGEFLQDSFKLNYFGIDDNKQLLDEAKGKLKKASLIKQDWLKKWPVKKDFDLIVFFGVIHHVPGKKNRLEILKKAKQHLKKGGLLVFSNWHFNKFKRFNKNVIKWKEFIEENNLDIEIKQIEKNDYVLDWRKGKTAYRYVHLVDDREIKWLIKNLGMEKKGDFISDGKQGQGNRYIILKKE